jgi:hypothetical protein
MLVLRRQKKSHLLENGWQVGRKEVPSGDEQDHKLDGESVAQARLPIIIEILDLLQLLHGIVDAIVHRTPPACQPVFAFSPVPARLNTG